MILNYIFELSMILDTDPFQRIFNAKSSYLKEVGLDGEYIDPSLAEKGITVVYRASKYKKKIRLIVNAGMVVDDPSNTDKLIRKLDKCISEYFNHRYTLDDFTLSGVTLTVDIDVDSREKVSDYLKVLQRIGKVKGFSPVDYDCFDSKASFCLSGNSNDIDFLLYDLEAATVGQLRNADAVSKYADQGYPTGRGAVDQTQGSPRVCGRKRCCQSDHKDSKVQRRHLHGNLRSGGPVRRLP